jgi:dipeptidyl-peptidase 4
MKKLATCLLVCITLFATAQKDITLEDIYIKNVFKAEGVAGFKSMKDGVHYSEIDAENNLVKVRFADANVVDTIVNLAKLIYEKDTLKITSYEFNAKENKLLLFTNAEAVYRHSAFYSVYIYDLVSKKLIQPTADKVMHPTFNADDSKLAYIKSNNLYLYDMATTKEKAITNDGKINAIINGNCDWVYEEEFGFTQAYSWDKTGKYLAYYRFDESQVKEFNFAMYNGLYPTDVKYKYPKAGEDNSKVDIFIYSTAKENSLKVNLGDDNDYYIPRIKWNPISNELVLYKLNRLQNNLTLFTCNPSSTLAKPLYMETNKYYIAINDEIEFVKNRNGFYYTSEKNGYNHIWFHDGITGLDEAITKGNFDVLQLFGVNEKNNKIYFTSAQNGPTEKQLYAMDLKTKKVTQITTEPGVHNISFSNGLNYFLDAYSSVNIPSSFVIKDNTGKIVRTLKTNAPLKSVMKNYNLAPQQLIKVPNGLGDSLNAWILKPANFNPSKKYPLFMFQYSGPGSQQVFNSFMGRDYWWYQMLAQKGYIILCVDGRGTGSRGEAFKKCTYKQLGKLESDDQIAVAKYFAKQTYIDASRIGIWGWSYGGYMSSICITKGADVFKSAIAVAPVTNWRYYDNIYTERYMQKPQDNAAGYDDNSPVNMVKNLKGNYLLIHGSADDNVHYQNAMEMINALIKADKDFDSEVYPNRAHGISGGNTRYHLYKRLTKFVLEKL